MKAIIITRYEDFDFKGKPGQVWPLKNGVIVTCPSCGERYELPFPQFTYQAHITDPSIGPASIRLCTCGWHGYMQNGTWRTEGDSGCRGPK